MKELLKNLLVLFLTLILMFFLTEMGLRIFWQRSDNFYQSDEKIGRIHIPGKVSLSRDKEFSHQIKINSDGFIGKDYASQKEEGVFRIVVLGDSIVEAMQVPVSDNFSSLLESGLNQSQMKSEVINLGVSGFGTGREYLALKHYGLKYQPDLVILGFTISNDIPNNYTEDEKDPSFVIDEPAGFKKRIKSFLTDNFKLVAYFREKSYSSIPLRNFLIKIGFFSRSKRAEENLKEVDDIPADYFIYSKEYPDFLRIGFEKTKYFLNKIKGATNEKEIKFLAVIFPTQEQIYEDIWREVEGTYPAMKNMDWDLEKPNQMLKNYFEENQITYLDLAPFFKKALPKLDERLYYKYDGHLNKIGHQLVGKILEEHILKLK
ncbi:MAG: hypothetical protein A3A94_03465 [Candidatus Portnoybacteria bacterium RIFCSPLOWO2_01_FULL_43_11]|uniref:Uncharacterized protein n=4 Tax=Bacteria candidate phyla TaxID=1783234 RepID=A0A1G2FSP8_9BACT|nr:MAG: hypothetical protein A2713_01800 [candidate division WWE3 bacterium RIFCSPHIGHO2_01_FULL_35_17]OGZ37835.1 MAG: hypothetical protein A3E90_03215 [Candidatus Portnoybacteria bacterium RIFCSPHIGHO2_12_FULL_40_11]OGZ38408.1 MAG: hypothetical protein A3A94_03465 [Candidatus Portnoybacteria bacterium RIFCSPLOWO2_01_FULL_43_11]OGZ40837.1 MAG: hypothetical protein A3I20_02430 [Candidatus Portnoybacteria bacterium RIFCSPLOWO2_02_FULL_40_15]